MVRREFSISAEEAGQRLDHVLRQRFPDVPRRIQSSWFGGGHVHLDGAATKKGSIAAPGQVCRVDAVVDAPVPPLPGNHTLSILFEDEHVLVIDKPAGMASAALAGSAIDSVAAHLLDRYPVMKDVGYSVWDAGLIHRLDTDTSGVMVAAKTRAAFEELVEALVGTKLTKSYLAWTETSPTPEQGLIATWLRSDPKHRQRMTAARPHQSGAKPCETSYEVIAREGDFFVVRASAALATRHQVRAHLAAIGSPLVADALYGGPASGVISHHALHAERVRFEGGAVCDGFDCRAKIPRDLAALTPQFAERANAH
jgi:23S rRNA pseudouridine1911/1915/1917 synthase